MNGHELQFLIKYGVDPAYKLPTQLLDRNEVRRRSLVNMKDVRENQRVRQPSEITEEVEDDPNNNSTSSKKLLSRPSTSESSHTFRITVDPGVAEAQIDVPKPAPRTTALEPAVIESSEKKTAEETGGAPFATGRSQHEAWLRRKIEEERKRKQREKQAALKKEEEEKERREQAKKLFERWKSERDEKLREEKRRQRAKEKEKRKTEEERKKEKQLEAQKAGE
ncbi:hypothetical protein TELCIR_10708 [Teladorsagia circumcincta]|uniref:Uncharacterized protein n=1 Tax=Teladorsagia circumcincta TaxID=45464 RepID=A0A2G9UBE3_TELCI|nr:hypothetical protein TELCIR_10708 [Teladorsagia circumcincta]